MRKQALLLILMILLAGCGPARPPVPAATDDPTPSSPAPSAGPVWTDAAVPGEERPALETDGLEGGYYNDYLRETLILDGCGGCTLAGAAGRAVGSYTAADGALTLTLDGETLTAGIDGRGDVRVEGRTGYYLRDFARWGISEDEPGVPLPLSPGGTETIENDDGSVRLRDFGAGVACTCAAGTEILTGRLAGAVAVTDGSDGYVTGRNVTAAWTAWDGGANAFLEEHIRTFTRAEFATLYGGEPSCGKLMFAEEDSVEGRLSGVVLPLRGPERAVTAELILYTSTYPDGTVNYIVKTYFAPEDDPAQLIALRDAVTDLSAVRMK